MPKLSRILGAALSVATLTGLASCAVVEPTVVGTHNGVIQRALAFCGEKTEAAETQCVRQALTDGHVTLQALVAMIPGCRVGTECSLNYTTRDRAGLLAVTATSYIFHWRVGFDLRKPFGPLAASVPLTVMQV